MATPGLKRAGLDRLHLVDLVWGVSVGKLSIGLCIEIDLINLPVCP